MPTKNKYLKGRDLNLFLFFIWSNYINSNKLFSKFNRDGDKGGFLWAMN